MNMFFHLESQVVLLHHHADVYIKAFGCLSSFFIVFAIDSKLRVVSVLNPTALILFILFDIYAFFHELFVEFIQQVEFTCKVYHRTSFAFLVNHEQ